MAENVLVRLFEHNNWANEQIIAACAVLSDEQLDAAPEAATKGSIRETLHHLAAAQHGYLSLLTQPVQVRRAAAPLFDGQPTLAALAEAVRHSGEGLLALAQGEPGDGPQEQLETTDGYWVAPWVVMVQVVNHAGEHREQIKSMLSALGVTPPDLDGWDYGEVAGALVAMDE